MVVLSRVNGGLLDGERIGRECGRLAGRGVCHRDGDRVLAPGGDLAGRRVSGAG